MPSVSAIDDLESRLSYTRELARSMFDEWTQTEDQAYNFPERLTPRAREISEGFHRPLVQLLSYLGKSQMFGDMDRDAVRLSVTRIDAALRGKRYIEWGPEDLWHEDSFLGIKPAGFSEDRRLEPREAMAEIDEALDHVYRRLGILRAEADGESTAETIAPRDSASIAPMEVRPGTAFIMMPIDPS